MMLLTETCLQSKTSKLTAAIKLTAGFVANLPGWQHMEDLKPDLTHPSGTDNFTEVKKNNKKSYSQVLI